MMTLATTSKQKEVSDKVAQCYLFCSISPQINGIIQHLVTDGLSILQYVDEIVIFLNHDLEQVKKLEASP
jgi:hypothetical protein